MSKPKIVVVTPTIRPEYHAAFVAAWTPLFERHGVTLVTVWDGDDQRFTIMTTWDKPLAETIPFHGGSVDRYLANLEGESARDLVCRKTDQCRVAGFIAAADLYAFDYLLTLDDDCFPPAGSDPIQEHLDVLAKRVPLSWMNTAMPVDHSWGGAFKNGDTPYLRGVPYGVRDEAPVMLSHGVWVNVPDFDGQAQLELEAKGPLPYTLPYYRGPIPRGVLFACCGMSVMVRRESLPHLYFAPMGADSGHPDLHRFADIFMGVFLKQEFDRRGWACYSGGSTIIHTRASDARKNFEQEKLGRQWMEWLTRIMDGTESVKPSAERTAISWEFSDYLNSYCGKRDRYAALIKSLLGTP